MHRFLFSILALTLPLTGQAAPLHLQSGPAQTATVELFTSHGCSSCPPADRWLSKLVDHPELWQKIVPMAFHVDYWDRLGWPDRFASDRYSQRQYLYDNYGGIRTVYTPGIVIKGREWKGFFRGRPADFSTGPEVGVLTVSGESGDSLTLSFSSAEQKTKSSLTAHIAILGFGLTTPIGGGENEGKEFTEEFVVLGHTTAKQRDANGDWQLTWPKLSAIDSSRLAVAAWISDGANPAPIQAVGGWVP